MCCAHVLQVTVAFAVAVPTLAPIPALECKYIFEASTASISLQYILLIKGMKILASNFGVSVHLGPLSFVITVTGPHSNVSIRTEMRCMYAPSATFVWNNSPTLAQYVAQVLGWWTSR